MGKTIMKRGGSKNGLHQEKPIIEGTLKKKAIKSNRNWKTRHFVLLSDRLVYYKKKNDSKPAGAMLLTSDHYVTDLVNAAAEKEKNVFVISDFDTTFYLAADSLQTKEFWKLAIANIIRKLLKRDDFFGEQSGVNRERTDSEVERDYLARIQAYKASRGENVEEEITQQEEDVVLAQMMMQEALEREREIEEEQKLQKSKERAEELEALRRAAEEELRLAKEAERKAVAAAKEAARMKKELEREKQKEREEEAKARQKKKERELEEKKRQEALQASAKSSPPSMMKRLSHRILGTPATAEEKKPEPVVNEKPKQLAVKQPSAPASGGIAARLNQWKQKINSHEESQKTNVFSGNHVAGAKISKNDANYGKAQAGSATEARAKAAAAWVDKEIDKLCNVVKDIGSKDENGKDAVNFGKLFIAYQDISDSLVGILMRAKKRKRLQYQGDMLFQGVHDNVIITLA